MPLARDVGELLDNGLDLARDAPLRELVIDERRVERESAKARERSENLDAVGVRILEQPHDALLLAAKVPLVDTLVLRRQRDIDPLDLLLGKVGGHVLLAPTQHERPNAAA